MKIVKTSKRLKYFMGFSCILFIGITIGVLIYNASIVQALNSRDTRLDLYEQTKMWVGEDIRLLESVKDQSSYEKAKEGVHMASDLKSKIFGSLYIKDAFAQADSCSLVDIQYSVDKLDSLSFYVVTNISVKGLLKELKFLVFVQDNMIYSILKV